MTAPEQLSLVTKERFAEPFSKTLNDGVSKQDSSILKSSEDLASSLNRLFPEQRYDKDLQKVKAVLGETANLMTPEQIKDIAVEVQFLVSNWLDDFERSIFGSATLRELLHERGGK